MARTSDLTANAAFTRRIVEVHGSAGIAWLNSLPQRVSDLESAWTIRAGTPVENLTYNFVAHAKLSAGTPAILKLGVPGEAIGREIEALRVFAGRGAVQVLAADTEQGALLLERLTPGTSLREVPDGVAIPVAAEVIRRLQRPAPSASDFPTTMDWAGAFTWLRDRFAGGTGPLPERLVGVAEALFRDLATSAPAEVLLHGDLHHDNILASEREPWLAIDPHGVVGDPAYETGAFLRNGLGTIANSTSPPRSMSRRVDHLSAETGFDPERVRGWGLAQAVLSGIWSLQDHDGGWEEALTCAGWLDAQR